nr:hypothetical protein [Tanacetum cinerariifolium]
TFKTLCLLNYALMIRHDYDITSSLRRGALQLVDKHTAEDDIKVFSTEIPGLDLISTHNFLTRLKKLYSYASGHLEVSELAACLS